MVMDVELPLHVWKPDLYCIQLDAPIPHPIQCMSTEIERPSFLGTDYHGGISHIDAGKLLKNEPEGAYLVRSSTCSNGEFYTLSLKFNNKINHYRLYYDDNERLYVSNKRYDCVRSLVADGLVTMYILLKAGTTLQKLDSVNYLESPYMTLNKRKLRALSRDHMKVTNLFNKPPDISPNFVPSEKYEKPHVFKVNTFKGLNWCELCGNFLWGFTAQGVKCEDCGFIAHAKCSEIVPNHCLPDLKHIRGVFGIDLTTLLTAHGAALPFVVVKCAQEVEARGLYSEGIYRLSGFAEEIETLKMTFDKDGDKADLSKDTYNNINVIAGALKLYLRLLPIPLITFDVHPKLIAAAEPKNMLDKIASIKIALSKLPLAHYNTLKYLMEHLHRVSRHQAINKMTAYNLAAVFAPTLMTTPMDFSSGPPDISTDIFSLELLINNWEKIFS